MKILVVDDHALVREGLTQVLQGLDGSTPVEVLQAASSAQALPLAVGTDDLDLIVLDYHLPDMNGLAVLSVLVNACPDVPVLVLSGTTEANLAQRAITMGAAAFVTKSGHSDELLGAVRRVLRGDIVLPKDLGSGVGGVRPSLTARQIDVLSGVLEGLGNREIALRLRLSEETIKTHVANLLRAFQARTRTQLALEADRWGYTDTAVRQPKDA